MARFKTVYLVLSLAAAVILGGVAVVAMGRGGEIAAFRRDLPVASAQFGAPSEVAALRLPLGLFGYQEQATRDALRAAARLLADRDAEIARLRDELWRLGVSREHDHDHAAAAAATTAVSNSDVLSGTAGAGAGGDAGVGQAGGQPAQLP